MAITDPIRTPTMEDFVDLAENNEIDYNSMALFTQDITDESFIYSFENVLSTYMEELRSVSVLYEMTDKEYLKYRYRPYQLSYDLYKTTQLYWVILYLNDTCNAKDFNLKSKQIRLIPGRTLKDLLEMIQSAEKDRIRLNREYIESKGADVQ